MGTIDLNHATTCLEKNVTSIVKNRGVNDGYQRIKLSAYQNARIDIKPRNNKTSEIYLDTKVIYKMVMRLLVEAHMLEEDLAEALRINVGDLKKIYSIEATQKLIAKINLPLIKLYCKAEFKNDA